MATTMSVVLKYAVGRRTVMTQTACVVANNLADIREQSVTNQILGWPIGSLYYDEVSFMVRLWLRTVFKSSMVLQVTGSTDVPSQCHDSALPCSQGAEFSVSIIKKILGRTGSFIQSTA